MQIRCNTARSVFKFLKALRSQSLPALSSGQVLSGNDKDTGGLCVFFSIFNFVVVVVFFNLICSAVH